MRKQKSSYIEDFSQRKAISLSFFRACARDNVECCLHPCFPLQEMWTHGVKGADEKTCPGEQPVYFMRDLRKWVSFWLKESWEKVIAFYKFTGRVNTREELFKLKGNVGVRTKEYELAKNNFKMEIKGRFVTTRTLKLSTNLSVWLGEIITCFKMVFNIFIKRATQYRGGNSVTQKTYFVPYCYTLGVSVWKNRGVFGFIFLFWFGFLLLLLLSWPIKHWLK